MPHTLLWCTPIDPVQLLRETPYLSTKNATLPYCKKCGICCQASGTDKVTLSQHDVNRLRTARQSFRVRKDGSVYKLVMKGGACPFLGPKGCVLPFKIRPLDCKTYPVHFMPDGEREFVTIAMECPLWNKIPPRYLAHVTKLAREEFTHWTAQERIGYWA